MRQPARSKLQTVAMINDRLQSSDRAIAEPRTTDELGRPTPLPGLKLGAIPAQCEKYDPLNGCITDKKLLVGGRRSTGTRYRQCGIGDCAYDLLIVASAIVGATKENVSTAPARKIRPRRLIGVGEVIAKISCPELVSIQQSRDDRPASEVATGR